MIWLWYFCQNNLGWEIVWDHRWNKVSHKLRIIEAEWRRHGGFIILVIVYVWNFPSLMFFKNVMLLITFRELIHNFLYVYYHSNFSLVLNLRKIYTDNNYIHKDVTDLVWLNLKLILEAFKLLNATRNAVYTTLNLIQFTLSVMFQLILVILKDKNLWLFSWPQNKCQ